MEIARRRKGDTHTHTHTHNADDVAVLTSADRSSTLAQNETICLRVPLVMRADETGPEGHIAAPEE